MLNFSGKCAVFGKVMQLFVHHQHDGLVKIKYRKALRPVYGLCIILVTVLCVNDINVEKSQTHKDSCEEAKTSFAEKQKPKGVFCGKGFLRSLHCCRNFMVTPVGG